MPFMKGDRVRAILSGDTGTVVYSPVPGYTWVNWDDGSRYPVTEDSLYLVTSAFGLHARELVAGWRRYSSPDPGEWGDGCEHAYRVAADELEELLREHYPEPD